MIKLIKKMFVLIFFVPSWFFKVRSKNGTYLNDFLVFLSLFFLLIYYGSLYFFYPFDPSSITVVSPAEEVINPFGAKGAWLSSLALYYFGLASWILPFPFLLLIFSLMMKTSNVGFLIKSFLAWFALFLSTLFLLSHYKVVFFINGFDFLAGGSYGFLLREWLLENWGVYGSHVFVVLFVWYAFVLVFNLNFISSRIPLALIFVIKAILQKFYNLFKLLICRLKIRRQKENQMASKTYIKEKKDLKSVDRNPLKDEGLRKSSVMDKEFFSSLQAIFKNSHLLNMRVGSDEKRTASLILKTFSEFGVDGDILDSVKGPSLTTYNFQPAEGVRQAKVYNLIDDLALALKVQCVMIKPAKDKRALGIQVPNENPATVCLGNILNSKVYKESESPLTLAFGLSEKGEPICEDLAIMPHVLIAGSTGSGKSVCINTFICSILAKSSPSQVRFLMIDPKMLELSTYNNIPHLLAPVVTTDLNKAKACLNWAVYEMERRYELMEKIGVRDLGSYNKKIRKESKDISPKRERMELESLPSIVVVIDELADLMLMAAKDIEQLIQRLAQKARACGIHLILATQRPSVDVVTGIIKANLPCRLSFRVVSRYDSKTILDRNDAEKLLGRGDLLFMKPGSMGLQRIQGAFVSQEEVNALVKKLKVGDNFYDKNVVEWIASCSDSIATKGQKRDNHEFSDTAYNSAKEIARSHGVISTSFLQRQLQLGYNRAARIVEKMEDEGLITKADGSKKRKWIKN